MTVLVFGSLNMDLVVRSSHLPQPGETVLGNSFEAIPGGKGANQAVAVARQQTPTIMVGRVGQDAFGKQLQQSLAASGVKVEHVKIDHEMHTGVASIAVAAQGENQIIVVPGANGEVGKSDLEYLSQLLNQAQYLLMQFEIPMPAVVAAAQQAYAAGLTVVIDPAPVQAFSDRDLYPYTHFLTPNQVEAAQLVGFPVETVEQAQKAIAALQQRGAQTVIVKLGEKGVVCGTLQETFHIPAFSVSVVDTVAAGDAFNGGLAAALYDGKPLREAIVWASATAALSVAQSGAQSSLPTKARVADFIKST